VSAGGLRSVLRRSLGAEPMNLDVLDVLEIGMFVTRP
jgi:hypothetical protein